MSTMRAAAGKARFNPGTKAVRLEFEDDNLNEVAIELSLDNLRILIGQLGEQIGSSERITNLGSDPLPLGGLYEITGQVVSRTQSGTRLTIHLRSTTGARFLEIDLSPAEASGLADDLLATASPE